MCYVNFGLGKELKKPLFLSVACLLVLIGRVAIDVNLYLEIDLCGARKRQHYEHDEHVDEVVVVAEVQLDTTDGFQRPRRRNNATYRQRSETHIA